jgi:hypothetical protein
MAENPAEQPVLTLTDVARKLVAELRADEPNAADLALWVEISGVSGGTFAYDVYFQATSDAGPGDAVLAHADLSVVGPRPLGGGAGRQRRPAPRGDARRRR